MLIKFDWVPTPSDLELVELDRSIFFKSFKFQVNSRSENEISFWTLELYFIRKCYKPEEIRIRITLKLEDASTTKYLLTTFDITFKSKVDSQLIYLEKIHLFRKLYEIQYQDTLPSPTGCWLRDKSNYPFEIVCNINTSLVDQVIYRPEITFDIEKLLKDGEFSDFTIVTPIKRFKVHKMVLAAKSEVFSAMFKHDMLEKRENSVNIIEFDVEVIQELLRYMYCGRVENLEKLSRSLLKAAVMYFVDGLKLMCLEKICEKVTFKNAVEILLLTIEHKGNHLVSRIINFIVYNIKQIDRTQLKSINDCDLLQKIFLKTIDTHL